MEIYQHFPKNSNTKPVHDSAQNVLLPCKTCYAWTLPAFLTLPVPINIDLHYQLAALKNCFPIIYNQILPTINEVQKPICTSASRQKLTPGSFNQVLPIGTKSNVSVSIRRLKKFVPQYEDWEGKKWGSVLMFRLCTQRMDSVIS